jgi:hypothetical protein
MDGFEPKQERDEEADVAGSDSPEDLLLVRLGPGLSEVYCVVRQAGEDARAVDV